VHISEIFVLCRHLTVRLSTGLTAAVEFIFLPLAVSPDSVGSARRRFEARGVVFANAPIAANATAANASLSHVSESL
jgi:hypothetical protein